LGRFCSQILTVTSIWEADVIITLLIFMKNQNIFITQNQINANHISMKSVLTSTKDLWLFIWRKTILFIKKHKQVIGNHNFCTQMLPIFGAFQVVWCFAPCTLAACLPILVWGLSWPGFHFCCLSLLCEEFFSKLHSCCWCDGSHFIYCMWLITDILCTNFWITLVVEHDQWLSLGTEKLWYSFIISVIRVKQSELLNLLVPSDTFAILSAIVNKKCSNNNWNITG
jgi:hypothetical protein